MVRGLGIVGAAFVVALALAPLSAQAQQISACVNNKNGGLRIIAQDATCSNNEHLLVWSAGTGGGLLAGSSFQCVGGQTISISSGLNFFGGISVGSGISTTGQQFNSIMLQPGFYQIHLSGTRFSPAVTNLFPTIVALLNNAALDPTLSWFTTVSVDVTQVDIVGGDRLLTVTLPNSGLQFVNLSATDMISNKCDVVITKLQ